MAAGQMEITVDLKYKFEGDPFALREHAVKFDLTNRALGGPSSGNVEYIISKSDSEMETHLQHPPEEGVQFQIRHRTFEGLKHAERLLSSLVERVKSDFDKMKKSVGVSEKAWVVIYEPVTVHCGYCGRNRKGTIANLEQHFRSHIENEFNKLAVRVSRIPPNTTKKDVTDIFGTFGEITNIRRVQGPSDSVRDRCAVIEYKSPDTVDSIINKDQAEAISIKGSKLQITRVKKGEEMKPPPVPPPPTPPPPTQELRRNQGSQRPVPGSYRQNPAPVPLNQGMQSINFEQLKDKPEVVAQLIGLFTAQQNQSNEGADGAAFADQVNMVLQQAFQPPQEGASAAAGGPGDFGRKRAGVEMPGGTPKRQRQEFTPFGSEQDNTSYTEQGEISGYAVPKREQGAMGTPSSAKEKKSSQSRLDALRQSIAKEEKEGPPKKVQFKGSKKHEPPVGGNQDEDVDDADDFVDDGGGSPMEQDNIPESSGDGDETTKVETPKPVTYEPRQVHVSGFSLVTNQEDLVSALTSEYGKISDCKMHRKAFKTQVTRFAVVEFEEESSVKKILGSKTQITSNVGRYRLTIARIAMESQDNEQSSGSAVKSANTDSETTSAEKKEYPPEIVEEQKLTVKVVTSLIELVDRTTFPEKTESVDENMMKKLNNVQLAVAKDLQRANKHRTITRMAYILNAVKGIDDEPRVAHTLYLWNRKILTKQFFHEPKDAGLLHIVQELEPAVEQALKTSAKFSAISLYRKIASIVSFVVDRKESDEEKAFAARGVKFRSKTANPGQGGGCFLRDEVDHPEDVPKYLDLHKGPDEVHEFDAVLGDDADVEFTGTREPQGLIGDVSIRSKKIGERKLTLNSPPDMAVKSARKIILQKMDEDNRMLSRPLPMLVKHTIQMCIHKIIAVLYYRNRKVINKFQQEDLTSQLIRQELKIAGKTPIEEPSRPIELSAVKYEKRKEPPSAKISLMQEQPTSIEPDEPMEQDEPKISPYAPPPEMATVSGPKDFRSYDEYPEEIQQAVIKWKKTVRYHEMHTKEQYTAIKKLKMELSQANRLIINKKMGAINQEEYTREETVDLRLCMIFEVKHKLEEKKKEKYEQKMKKAKMEKEKKKHKKDKEKEKEREKEKPKPKKHVLALSSTSSDSDSDLDLPKKTPPKTSQQTPQKEKHRVDPVAEGKADSDVKRKLIAEKKEKEQSVVKVEATEKETAKKETEGEKETIEEAKKSEPKSTSQKSETESSDKNPDLSEVDEEERKEDQNKKVAVKSEISTPEKAAESKSTKIEATKSNEVNVAVTSKTKKDNNDSGDNIFQKLSKDLTLQSKDSEDGSKRESSKDAEVKPSEDGMNQNDSLPVVSKTDKPENVPEVPQNDEVKAAEVTSPEKEEGPLVSKSRSRSVSRSSSSSGSSGRSPSNSSSRSRSVSRASSRSSRASSRSGSRANSNSGSRASSRSSSRASSRSGSNASSRSGSRSSAKSRSRSRSNSGSRSGSGSRAASPSRSRSRSKSSSVPRSRSGSNASSRSNSRSVSRSRSRSKSSSISRSRSRSNSGSSSAASVKSASSSESNDEDGNLGKSSTSENKEAEHEDSVRNMEGKDISNAGNEAKKDTSDENKKIEDDKEVERKASPVQNLGIRSPERVEDDKIVASDSSGPASPKYPSSGSEAEAKEAGVKDLGGDEHTIDTEMQEVIEQVINLQEQMGVTEKEPSTTVQDSIEGTQKATESEAAQKDTTEVEMQQVTPEPTLEDDIRDAEISMETTNTPPEPEESAAAEAVDDDDDDDDDSSDDDDSYETDSSSLVTGSPAASLQVTGYIELTKEEASKAFYEELTSEQRRCVYKELERNVRIQKKVGIPYTHEEKSAIKTQLIGKYLKIQREDPNSKGEILTNLEKKELKRLKKEERKRHKKKRRKEKHERRSGSDGRSPKPMKSPRELPAQYMDLPAQYADPTPDEILEANLSDGDSWRQRNKKRSDHREPDSHRSRESDSHRSRESDSHRSRDRDDRREPHRAPRARRGGGWNSRGGHSSSSRDSESSHRWEREDRRRSPHEGSRYRDDRRDRGNYHDSRRQQRW